MDAAFYRMPEFLQKFKQGDQIIFKMIYEDKIWSLANYLTVRYPNIPVEAKEDILGDTFYALFNNRMKINSYDHLGAFLFTVMKNNSVDYFRRRSVEIQSKDDIFWHTAIEDETDEYKEKEEYLKVMEQAIAQLPPQQKKILILNFYEHKTVKEIQELLKISYQTVLNHRTIAINTLLKKLPFAGNKLRTCLHI